MDGDGAGAFSFGGGATEAVVLGHGFLGTQNSGGIKR